MSIKKTKSGVTVCKSPDFSIDGIDTTQFAWLNHPTFKQRPQTLYGLEVVDKDGNPVSFIAHPRQFKDTLN